MTHLELHANQYEENKTALLRLIRSGDNNDENQIEQLRDWSYSCGFHLKWNWVIRIDQISCSLW